VRACGRFQRAAYAKWWRSSQRTRPKPSEVTVTALRPGRAHKISGVILIVAGAAWEFLEEVFQWTPQSHNAGWQLLRIDPLSRLMILGGIPDKPGHRKLIYPVIAAVTGPALTFAPPAFFGAYSKNWPLPRSMVRGPLPTLKIVFSPRRVIV